MLAGFCFLAVCSVDGNQTIIIDIDLDVVFFHHAVDGFAALADDNSDLVRIDHEGKCTRCVLGHFRTRRRDFFQHFLHDEHSSLFCLSESFFQNVSGQTMHLDIHLDCSDTDFGTGYLEVHVAQEIFHALNVGQNREFRSAVFLYSFNEAHCNTCNRALDRNAGIHQSQAGSAGGTHGSGPVGR